MEVTTEPSVFWKRSRPLILGSRWSRSHAILATSPPVGPQLQLGADQGLELTLQSVHGLFHWAGAGPTMAWIADGSVAVIVTLAIIAIWTKPISHSRKAAALCVGSVAVTPYVAIYDLCILTIAVAFFVSDGLARGFLPGERMMILICWAGLFLLLKPFGPIIDVVILLLIARRIAASRGDTLATSRSTLVIGSTFLRRIIMSEAPQRRRIGASGDRGIVRPLGVFADWRLQAYG
jgi:hypothetical protein